MENSQVTVNSFVFVVWGEEQASVPALVTEVINANEFRALIRPEGSESNLGPFRFHNSDLDRVAA